MTEEEIKAAFLIAFNMVLGEREEIMEAYKDVIEALTDTSDLDVEREQLESESEVVLELIRKCVSENAQKAQDQTEYQRKYENYCGRFEQARARLAEIADLCLERTAKRVKIQMFMDKLKDYSDLVLEFDEELWYSTVDHVTVYEDKRMVFTFRDGKQVDIYSDMWEAA